MKPLVASLVVAGFPMTSLLSGTPDAAIWKSAVFGHVELDVVSRPAQVVYSDEPSGASVSPRASYLESHRLTVVELDVILHTTASGYDSRFD